MSKTYKKLLAVILVVALLLSSLPLSAMAQTIVPQQTVQSSTESAPQTEAYIIGEDASMRKQDTKYFLMSDGSYKAAVYNTPVHYLENGQWEDIDNSLQETTDSENGDVLKNKKSDFSVKFSKKAKENKLVTTEKDGYKLSWYLEGVNKVTIETITDDTENDKKTTLKNLNGTAIYKDILKNIDLSYTVTPKSIKEDIVLNKSSAQNQFTFVYDIGKLSYRVTDNGDVELYSEEKPETAVYTIEKAYMYDAAGEYSDAVTMDVQSNKKKELTITLTADKTWLEDENRVYPVTIDPTIIPAYTAANIKDNTAVFGNYNSGSAGYLTNGYLRVGKNTTIGNLELAAVVYADIPSEISPTCRIMHAEIALALCSVAGPSKDTGVKLSAYTIESDWNTRNINEDVYLFNNTSPARPQIDSEVLDYITVTNTVEYRYFDITRAAQSWMVNNDNYGIMFRMDSTQMQAANFVRFYSSDYGTGVEPSFIFQFCDAIGLEDYWSYHSASVGNAGTGYVNDFNGNLTFTRTDATVANDLYNVSVEHVYNSNQSHITSKFGNGWMLNVMPRLLRNTITQKTGTQTYYYIIDSDNTGHYFQQDDDGVYRDENGLGMVYAPLNNTGIERYKVTTKDKTQFIFDAYGYMRIRRDTNGNEIHYNYDTSKNYILTSITDKNGTLLFEFIYNSSNTYLQTLKDVKSGREIKYAYDSAGNLISTTVYAGDTSFTQTYTYSGKLLTSVTDETGYKLQYGYTQTNVTNSSGTLALHRVTSVSESFTKNGETVNGQTLNINYESYCKTSFEDCGADGDINTKEDNNTSFYMFDYYGQPVSVTDDEGNSSAFKYNTEMRKQHSLSVSGTGDKINPNLLTNHSFESNTSGWTFSGSQYYTTNEDTYHGSYSLSVDRPSSISSGVSTDMSQMLTLDAGTYTFSVYIKSLADEPIDIEVYANPLGNAVSNTHTHISTEGNDGWVRRQVTIVITTDNRDVLFGIQREEKSGRILIDAAKLEKCDYATEYNLLLNGEFDDPLATDVSLGWVNTNNTSIVAGSQAGRDTDKVLKINKCPGVYDYSYAVQVVNISGSESDVFRISGWSKAAAMPDSNSQYGIAVAFVYNNGTNYFNRLLFNKDINDWQYSSLFITADDHNDSVDNTYKAIHIYVYYTDQMNAGYFDDIQLVKDNAVSYTYDDEGNLLSAYDLSSKQQYEYDGDSRLTSYIDATGSNFKYHYDSKGNMLSAMSNGGIEQTYTYNSYGQATYANTIHNTAYTGIKDGGVYYMRLKSNGKYFDVISAADAEGGLIQQHHFIGTSRGPVQKYTLNKTDDGYYTITANLSASGRRVSVSGGSNTDGASIVINSPVENDDSQKFKLEYVGNGGYRIVAKCSNGTKCISNYTSSVSDCALIKLQTINETDNDQIWYFEDAAVSDSLPDVDENTVYSIRNANFGNYFTVNAASATVGTAVKSSARTNTFGQQFILEKYGDTQYYYIRPIHSENLVVQVGSSSSSSLTLAEKSESDYQLFTISLVTSNPVLYGDICRWHKIIPKAYPNNSLGTTVTNGAAVSVGTYTAQTELWAFEPTLVSFSSGQYGSDGTQLNSTQNALGTSTNYTYDSAGRVTGVTITDGENSQSTSTAYDGFSRVTSVSSGGSTVSYEYDGTLLDSISTSTTDYTFSYGDFNKNTAILAGEYTLASYLYNDYNGLLSRLTYGNGSYVDYVYDKNGNVTEKKQNGTSSVKYRYDNLGRLIFTDDISADTQQSYTYDFIGRITSTDKSNGTRLGFYYDAQNRASQQNSYALDMGRQHQYHYSDDGLLLVMSDTAMNSSGDAVFDYTYDGLRRLSGYGIRDIVNVSYTYKKGYNGQETSLVESLTFGSDVYNYSYDVFGNITSITKNGTLYESYTYDSLNQIKTVTNGTDTWQYNYDTNGNITSVTKNGTTVKTYTYGNASWKDLLTNYNGTNITYDTIGNPNNWHSGMSFTWQNGRQLQGITKGTNTYSYTYDSNGLRTSKTVNGVTTNYYTIEGTLLAETKGNDTIRYLQDNNGKHYGFIYNGTMYYYTFNLQGDVTGILDSTGVKVVEYTYDIWGKVLSVTGTLASTIGQINPIRYRGYYYDSETGFYYLQSRYYDPEVGRFLNADRQISGVGGDILGYNQFSYCFNNPVNMSDETGNWPKWLSGALNAVSGALQVAAGATIAAVSGWTGVGLVAGGVLVANGTATFLQGVGQITNDLTNTNVLPEENVIKASVEAVGRSIGGDTGAAVTGTLYDATILAASMYGTIYSISNQMPSSATSTSSQGVPFQPGKTGLQIGVDPNTLTPTKNLLTLSPQRIMNAVKYGGNQSVVVGITGIIHDGHHRVADAIASGRVIDVFVEPFK